MNVPRNSHYQQSEKLNTMRENNIELENEKVKYEMTGKVFNQNRNKLNNIMEGIAQIITEIIEIRDPHFTGHQKSVSKLATAIAEELNLSQDKIEGIKFAALVYDLGKANLPVEITTKIGKLAKVEYDCIKNHPKIGHDIFKKIDFPWPIAEVMYQHHERLDGSGYPRRLKGNEILLEAKIIAVADVVEAMSSERPYRPAFSIKEALEEISKNKGILYDEEVVDACIKLFTEKNFTF